MKDDAPRRAKYDGTEAIDQPYDKPDDESDQATDPPAPKTEVNQPPAAPPRYSEPARPTGKSLSGIGGALVFWIIALGLSGLGWLASFFVKLAYNYDSLDATASETIIFSILLAGLYITTLVKIILTQKIAVLLAYLSIAMTACYITVIKITELVTYNPCANSWYYTSCQLKPEQIITAIGVIVSAWVAGGLIALYFWRSQRVKQTLVN
jgi:hypothetical protein